MVEVTAQQLEIRALQESEVRLVSERLPWGPPTKHQDRLACQQRGEAVYLIAWLADQPVGHALLRLEGAGREPMLSWIRGCPHVEDLLVAPQWRSQGIGSKILAHLEQIARERGYHQVGLGVALDNVRARRLYHRLGYRDAGMGPYESGWSYLGTDGEVKSLRETCVYLVRKLGDR